MIKIVQDDMTKTLQDQMGCYISFGWANDIISHAVVVVYNYEGVEEVLSFESCLIMIGIDLSQSGWYQPVMMATWPYCLIA